MAKVWIKGYKRADGTTVDGHYRELSFQQITRQEKAAHEQLKVVSNKLKAELNRVKEDDWMKSKKIKDLYTDQAKLTARANSLMRASELLGKVRGNEAKSALSKMRKGLAYDPESGFFMPKKRK